MRYLFMLFVLTCVSCSQSSLNEERVRENILKSINGKERTVDDVIIDTIVPLTEKEISKVKLTYANDSKGILRFKIYNESRRIDKEENFNYMVDSLFYPDIDRSRLDELKKKLTECERLIEENKKLSVAGSDEIINTYYNVPVELVFKPKGGEEMRKLLYIIVNSAGEVVKFKDIAEFEDLSYVMRDDFMEQSRE